MQSRVDGGALIIEPGLSRLDASVAPGLKEQVSAVLPGAPTRVVIDLSGVSFVDSSGLGALVALLKRVGPTGSLVLAGVQPPVAKLLALTRLDRVFEVQPSVRAALSPTG